MTVRSSVAVGNGGSYVNGKPSVGNAGAWHAVKNAWAGNGGAWAQFYAALGPFSATNAGYGGEGSGFAGTCDWSGQVAAFAFSGGPVSGSFSYAWSYASDDVTITPDRADIAQPTFSGSFAVPPATTATDNAIWQCVITDLVSGFSHTVTGIAINYQYTNNSG